MTFDLFFFLLLLHTRSQQFVNDCSFDEKIIEGIDQFMEVGQISLILNFEIGAISDESFGFTVSFLNVKKIDHKT